MARRHGPGQKLDRPYEECATRRREIELDALEADSLRKGDIVLVEAGDVIPADGEVIDGVASVDESGHHRRIGPVIREAGGDFSPVTGGTRVLSDWIVMRMAANPARPSSTA